MEWQHQFESVERVYNYPSHPQDQSSAAITGHPGWMTTEIFPLNEQRVRHIHDMVMYLWRAHNIVNNRLHGDITEDPQFLKYQFPPLFLCPSCHAGGHFSRRQVRNFLLRYYSNIKPHHRIHSSPNSAATISN
uniref:Thiol oxidase n=1 Tax=Ditylenchus dipsaci TaxID=166011 RepID=A0A915CLU1_9BILA